MAKGFCSGTRDVCVLGGFVIEAGGMILFSGKADGIDRARVCRVFEFVGWEVELVVPGVEDGELREMMFRGEQDLVRSCRELRSLDDLSLDVRSARGGVEEAVSSGFVESRGVVFIGAVVGMGDRCQFL